MSFLLYPKSFKIIVLYELKESKEVFGKLLKEIKSLNNTTTSGIPKLRSCV